MTALSDFQARVAEVAALLDTVAPGWWPDRLPEGETPPVTPHERAGVLSRSSIVLLTSYFEGFLKDLTDEAFDRIAEAAMAGAKLSNHLRGHAMLTHVHTLRTTEDPKALWACVEQLITLGAAYTSTSAISANFLPREQVKRAVTSIDPKRINELLRSLGDGDLNRGPMSKYSSRLQGLKQIRDNAVHGNEQELPALGYGDVSQNLTLLLESAAALSVRVDELVLEAVSSTP